MISKRSSTRALILVATFSLLGFGEGGNILTRYKDKKISQQHTDYVARLPSTCACRSACALNATCAGVTVTPSPPTSVLCAFTALVVVKNNLTQLNGSDIVTYLKSPPCDVPFHVVPKVGCIFVSSDVVSYQVAETSCPPGSQLASPHSDEGFWDLSNYLNGLINSSVSTMFIVGIKCVAGVWTWLDGHTIPSAVGSSVWADREPSGGFDCARITFETNGITPRGSLADLPCTTFVGRYVCWMP